MQLSPSPSVRLRVLVHSHQRFLRDGVARLLDDSDAVSVVGRTHRASELCAVASRVEPDVVVVHVDLIDLDLMAAVDELRHRTPPLRVVALGSRLDPRQWDTAHSSAVDAFVPAAEGVEALLAAISNGDGDSPAPAPRLTPREQRVLELVGHGLKAREIGQALGITPKTVENHKARIFAKLGVQNGAHAVTLAVRAGLVRPMAELRVSGDG